jgi:uncharacterized SAM-dependent methyltransferase
MSCTAPLAAPTPRRGSEAFRRDLIAGLSATPKSVSPKYFYDDAGSALFDAICGLPEYYPTRKEIALLQRHGAEIAAHIGPEAELIEFGAGSVVKIRHLFDTLELPRRFTPIDISGDHLHAAAAVLRRDYPGIEIRPVVADFTQPLNFPIRDDARRVGFFPGSSIGNFTPEEALAFHGALQPQFAGQSQPRAGRRFRSRRLRSLRFLSSGREPDRDAPDQQACPDGAYRRAAIRLRRGRDDPHRVFL